MPAQPFERSARVSLIPVYQGLAVTDKFFARASRFNTDDTCQRPPRADRMPRSLSARVIASRVVAPVLRIASTTGISPATTRKGDKQYRYYVSNGLLKGDDENCTVRRVPAAEIENAVIDQVRILLRSPEIIVRTWRAARKSIDGIREDDVRAAMERLDPLWNELFPAEQARIVQLLVERIDISPTGADIRLRTEGLTNLVNDLGGIRPDTRGAAA
jgi:hypothetical protein